MSEKQKIAGKTGVRFGRDMVALVLLLVIVGVVNFIGLLAFERFDLTSEGRYSISDASQQMVEELEDVVLIKVYLDGELTPNYQRLKNAIKESLDEFRVFSDNVQYEFINPSENPNEQERNAFYSQLQKAGLQWENDFIEVDGVRSERVVWPGAIMSYNGEEVPVQFFKSNMLASEETAIENSIQQIEYEISRGLKKLTRLKRPSIAFIMGHGELTALETADFGQTLGEYYNVKRVEINGQLNALRDYDGIIIAEPDSVFSDKDKFIIDQFIMGGGRALWMVDMVEVSIDSLEKKSMTFAVPKTLGIEEMLFKYGARINTDLIQDLSCVMVPVFTGYSGDRPKFEPLPWPLHPLALSSTDHPITQNLDGVRFEFVSTVDTIGAKGIDKSVILRSSPKSRVMPAPCPVSLTMMRDGVDPEQFNKGSQTMAVLLEGKFESVFKNRMPPSIKENPDFDFREDGVYSRQIVIGDGDVARNKAFWDKQEFLPLGYDQYNRVTYANKPFLLNCMNFLFEDEELIQARNKQVLLRLLDKPLVDEQREVIQATNLALPIVLILLFALARAALRKRNWTYEQIDHKKANIIVIVLGYVTALAGAIIPLAIALLLLVRTAPDSVHPRAFFYDAQSRRHGQNILWLTVVSLLAWCIGFLVIAQ